MKIGFISDIHEDIQSLEKALDILSGEGCDNIVCLGDITGFVLPFYRYIPVRNTEACIKFVRQKCSVVVAGNHDLYAARRIPKFSAGFEYGDNWYNTDYKIRAKRAQNKIWLYEDGELPVLLSGESSSFLMGLNELERVDFGSISFLFSHFCYPDFSGSTIHFPAEANHLRTHFEYMQSLGCIIGVSGHGHPEGFIIVSEDEFKFYPFGTYQLRREIQWIVVPCVARTMRSNGVLIIDSESMKITAIRIHKIKPFF